MKDSFAIIEEKLNGFIRRFYTKKLFLGLLFFVVFAVVAFSFSFFAESYLYFSPLVKTFLFYSFIFILASDLVFFVIVPLLKIFKILPVISYEEASKIISAYFPESKDTLLNLIQLHYQQNAGADSELLLAAVDQKSEIMIPLSFISAVDFKSTFKYLGLSLALIFLISLFTTFNFDRFKRGASQFINHTAYYQPENPYSFTLNNDELLIGRGEDFTVSAQIEGPSYPNDVFLNLRGNSYRMNIDSTGFYSYTFRNVSSDLDFNFTYLGFDTEIYSLKVFDKPSVSNFTVSVTPPAYTELKGGDFENTGDLSVPRGSLVTWNFSLQNADQLLFYCDSLLTDSLKVASSGEVSLRKTALKDFSYNYALTGGNGYDSTFSSYSLKVIPDVFPSIEVVSSADSSSLNAMYFSGNISDDYGFHSLQFVYFEKSNPKQLFTENIEFVPTAINQDFFFYFDFSKFKSTVDYYFEVKDNDAVSGFKSSKTTLSSYNLLTPEQKEQRLSDLNNSLYDKINDSKSLLDQITKDLDDFLKSVSGNNNLSDFEKQSKIENLLEKQNRFEQLLKQISDDNFRKDLFQNNTENIPPDVLEQQKQMQQLWNDLLNDDVKELLDQINKLKDNLSERNLRDQIENLKFDYSQIQEQLERNNQLLQYFSTEKKLNDLTQDLHKLSEDYAEFSRETFKEDSQNPSQKNRKKKDKDSQNQANNNSDNNNSDNKNSDNKNSDNNNSDNQNTDNINADNQNSDSQSDSELNSDNNFEDFKEQFESLKEKYEELMKQNSELGEMKLNIDSLFEQFKQISDELEQQSKDFEQMQNVQNNQNFQNPDKNKDNSNQNNQQNGSENNQNNQQNNTEQNLTNQQNNSDQYQNNQQNNTDLNQNNQQNNSNPNQNNQNNGSENQNSNQNNNSNTPQNRQNLQQQMQQTSEKIQQLADQMNGNNQGAKQKKNTENLNDVRQILDNLVNLSFSQEELSDYTNSSQNNALFYQELSRRQLALRNDFNLVRDSIYALAKREPKLGHAVYSKIDDINTSITQSLSFINDNNKNRSAIVQRNTLTGLNDLALIFSEIEQNMQQQMQQGGSSGEDSNEPVETRNKKRAQQRQQQYQQAKSNQQSLIQSLQQMIKQMQEGKNPSSQQMAESLRMQEMMQQYLQQLQNSSSPQNQQTKDALNQINQLIEQNKRDIINRNITPNLLDRQNQVLKKLLDAENAERHQEFDENRESNTGNNFDNRTNAPDLPFKKQQGTKEFIFRNYLNIDLFYLDKYNLYMQNIK